MDTKESESEEDEGEQVKNQEGEELVGEDTTGSGEEEETREDVDGLEGSKVEEDKEVEPEGERVIHSDFALF